MKNMTAVIISHVFDDATSQKMETARVLRRRLKNIQDLFGMTENTMIFWLSHNPYIFHTSALEKLPELPWNWDTISAMAPGAFLLSNIDQYPWDWKELVERDTSDVEIPDRVLRECDISLEDLDPIQTLVHSEPDRYLELIEEINPHCDGGWDWDWEEITANVKSYRTILDNMHYPWRWDRVRLLEVVRAYPNMPYDISALSNLSSLSIADVVEIMDKVHWNWKVLSANPAISMKDVVAFPELPWDQQALALNPNMRQRFSHLVEAIPVHMLASTRIVTVKHIVRNYNAPWDWKALSANKKLATYKTVVRHRFWPWVQSVLESNPTYCKTCAAAIKSNFQAWQRIGDINSYIKLPPNITLALQKISTIDDILFKYPEANWDWTELSSRKDVAIEIVQATHDRIPWDWWILSKHASIRDVCAHPDLPWNWDVINTRDDHTDIEVVVANPQAPWNWSRVSSWPSVTIDIVLANPAIPWDDSELSTNPSITIDDVLLHFYKRSWDLEAVISHKNVFDSNLDRVATRIQTAWRSCSAR